MEGSDGSYEFNAPQFYDFTKIDEDDDNTMEDYFNFDHENGVPVVWGEGDAGMKTRNSDPGKSRPGAELREGQSPRGKLKAGTKRPASVGCSSDKPKGDAEPRSPSAKRRKGSFRDTSEKRSGRDQSQDSRSATTGCAPSMIPSLMKRGAAMAKKVKTSEQLEIEKMQKMQKETAKMRQMAAQSMKKALSSQGQKPGRSVMPVTKMEEFHFATDQRLKSAHAMETRAETQQKEFVASLRKHANREPAHKGPTKVEPFQFHDTKHKHTNDTGKKIRFESMAEQLNKFSSKTPDRFHSNPRKRQELGSNPQRGNHKRQLTAPHTPMLTTKTRKRTTSAISANEREEQEVEEMKKNQFKAKPMNKKIFEVPSLGVKKVVTKATTQPVGFSFESQQRTRSQVIKPESPQEYQFHAKPVPKEILEKPTGVKQVRPQSPTVPQSPAFALRSRARESQNKSKEEEPPKKTAFAHPVPHVGTPFIPQLDHKATVLKPFSFEQRDKVKKAMKEEKIKTVLEEEKKQHEMFRAQMMPEPSPDKLPKAKKKPPTKQQPFQLDTDMRGSVRAAQWGKQVQDELEQQKEALKFKAGPNKVIYTEPYVPKRPQRVLEGKAAQALQNLDVNEFELSTERRARERDNWEAQRKQKEATRDEMNRLREKENAEREMQEVQRLRSEATHQANPVRHYKPVVIHQSEKPPTDARTPRFSERIKHRSEYK